MPSLVESQIKSFTDFVEGGAERVFLGEVGRVFFARDGNVVEEERLALALGGKVGAWDAVRAADFRRVHMRQPIIGHDFS